MTTVIDPLGTPTIAYNRSGTAIVSLVGGLNLNGSPPIGNEGVDIPRVAGTTVLLATPNTTHDGAGNISGHNSVYRLPVDSDVGDVVEAYLVSSDGAGALIFPQVGEQILALGASNGAVSTGTNASAVSHIGPGVSGCQFRKISSSTWVVIGTP